MQSKALKAIYKTLKATGLYDLSKSSNIYAELKAYDIAFLELEKNISKVASSIFVQSADNLSLLKHERLVGLHPRPNSSSKNRKEMVQHRLSITPNIYNKEEVARSIKAAGIDGNIVEYGGQEMVSINIKDIIDPSLTMEQIQQSLESLMPAHIDWSFNYGILTFDMLDNKNFSWNDWDIENFSWNTFDQDGEHLFT